MVQIDLIRCVEIEGDLLHFGQNHQNIGINAFRQKLGTCVLVNDGCHSLQFTVVFLNDRNTASSDGNGDSCRPQGTDRIDLNDSARFG